MSEQTTDVLDITPAADEWTDPDPSEPVVEVEEHITATRCRVDPFTRTRDKVAIVGFTDHRKLAFELGDDFELWGLNELYRYEDVTRFHRWFEIHPRSDFEKDEDGRQHLADMAKLDIPIYMHDHFDDIPCSLPFPKDELERNLGSDYFTSTPAWMIGMAIAFGFKEIHVYGVDMAQDCLAPDTKLLTSDLRWVRADEVEVGDELLAFDEEPGNGTSAVRRFRQQDGGGVITEATTEVRAARHWRTSKVLGRSVAKRPSYRIHFADGTEVVASAGHMWLTQTNSNTTKWKRTDELVTAMHRPGRPTKVVRLLDTWEHDRSWEAGYLAAAFDGEGTVGQSKHRTGGTHALCLSFSQRENAMADRVRVELGLKGFRWGEYPTGAGTTTFAIRGGRPEMLRLLGQIRPERILERFDPSIIGIMQRKELVPVVRVEPVGDVETVGFTTETGTLIAEGFASHNSEYVSQRPCCEFWLGRAQGAGIKTYRPPVSDLLSAVGQYGFGSGSAFSQKVEDRLKFLHARDNAILTGLRQLEEKYAQVTAEYNNQKERLTLERMQMIGAIQDCNFWKRSWAVGTASNAQSAVPDRSQDPQTGIQQAA